MYTPKSLESLTVMTAIPQRTNNKLYILLIKKIYHGYKDSINKTLTIGDSLTLFIRLMISARYVITRWIKTSEYISENVK